MTFALPPEIWVAFISGVTAAALWRGGSAERIGALTIYFGWIATLFVQHHRWHEVQWGMLTVDLIVLGILVTLALRAHRYWPLWAAGFQLLAIVTHLAKVVDSTLGSWAYITVGLIWSYMLVGALAVGTWNAWRARDRGEHPDPMTDQLSAPAPARGRLKR